MKSVCIVGAGPAGLVTAKTFLNVGDFSVTIFEAADSVGGMWRGKKGEIGDKCSPEMRTNLSRFTVAFPDLSWSAVDLSSPDSPSAPPSPPMFPKARQVGQYLETYARKFDIHSHIKFNTSVTNAKYMKDTGQWEISSKNLSSREETKTKFDYLIVASGFFGKADVSFDPTPQRSATTIQHSSSFRTLPELTKVAGKVAVIGGGISGAEAAAEAAFQISNFQTQPDSENNAHKSSTVYHIINRPFYALPRYLPQEPQQPQKLSFAAKDPPPTFLPLDLVLYNLSRRGGGTISAAISTVPPEKASKGHEFLRGVINGGPGTASNGQYAYDDGQTRYPAYTGITDTYTEFVRSGTIVQVQGWVDGIQSSDNSTFCVTLSHKEPWSQAVLEDSTKTSTITNVVGIIEATGYNSNLDYLDTDVKDKLDYDPTCPRIPVILTRGSIFAPDLPTLAFVGFYEGPYWGVMDMQARVVAQSWIDQLRPHASFEPKIYGHDDAENMRKAMKERSLQVPQFWMMDYIGLLEELARDVGVERSDQRFGASLGPAFPSRYSGDETKEALQVINEVAELIEASRRDHRFVAAAVFRGLQGTWSLDRRIESRNSVPGGIFSGTARFLPRLPTSSHYSSEYLYIEEGKFTPIGGDLLSAVPATRRYIYRYDEFKDQITAWFTDDDGVSPGSLFNKWEFQLSKEGPNHSAIGHHWCDPDTYKNICDFAFQGASLDRFGIKYEVSGPNKDYHHQSWYERPKLGHGSG